MTYLFGQVWLWMLVAFPAGALVVWLLDRVFRKPRVEVFEDRFMDADRGKSQAANRLAII
ncbi:LSU ribosomal protein L4p (L1e) [Alloactinosynnema sp. L-07]|uniref:hypothetical protein n=1 Tax=Alloactinosynnema sp. L-07 TaxID=1653480 RepID=UPI00065EFB88|nr:hypothetical protein [Alloactinosynnema sp. L-07]CRK60112.1 LSU ribosomal protein L4p (L1e) [Alloactinosynnema sp. L-07]